ncbi:MAG: hypothetical protein H7Y31_03800 [Chitinophagaceae bacterium]|nr:hypothetical protein [Chitinophagaceae bacterium]
MNPQHAIIRTRANSFAIIATAGLVAGFLDGAAAAIQFYINTGKNPSIVFKYISSAIIGKEAFAGGTGMVVLGIFLHLLIACIFAALFYVAYVRIRWMQKNVWASGVLYGVIVWTIMNYLIVPMSKIGPPAAFDWQKAMVSMLIIIFCVGLPIALITAFRMKRVDVGEVAY